MTDDDLDVEWAQGRADWLPPPDPAWLESPEAEAVRAKIAAKDAEFEQTLQPPRPAFQAPRKTADEALAELGPEVRAFIEKAADTADRRLAARLDQALAPAGQGPRLPEGEQALALSGLGVGKTGVALSEIGAYLGGPAPGRVVPRRVTLVVPDHALAQDLAERFRAMFPDVPHQVHLGIERPDPSAPGFDDPAVPDDQKMPMCRRLSDVLAAIGAGGQISAICGSRTRGHCPHHAKHPDATPDSVCGRTRTKTIKHGLLILAGPAALTQAPPSSFARATTLKVKVPDPHGGTETITKQVSLPATDILVADEPRFLSMLGGFGDSPYDVSLDDITKPIRRLSGDPATPDDEADAETVKSGTGGLVEVLGTTPLGSLSATTIRRVTSNTDWGLVRRCALAFKAEPSDFVGPDTPRKELHDTLKRLRIHNNRLFTIARLSRVLQDAAAALEGHADNAESGLIDLVENDEGGHSLRLRWIENVADAWRGTPFLALDATANVETARRWLPDLKIIADAKAATPACVTRKQAGDRVFSYLSWTPRESKPPADDDQSSEGRRERTAWNNIGRLARLLVVRCAQYHREGANEIAVLAVVPDRTEQALNHWFEQHGGKPAGLALLHYQKVRGLDGFGGVRALLLVSRPQPATNVLERMGWTLTGVRGTPAPKGKLIPTPATYTMRDGSAAPATAITHPDPDVERVRAAICDDELIQAEGRARAVRRTPDKPLSVEILTSVPLPLEIDAVVPSEDILADAHPAHWLVAAGVAPVLGTKGVRTLLGSILGMVPNTVRTMLRRDPTWAEALPTHGSKGTFAIRQDSLMENVPFEETGDPLPFRAFQVQTTATDRYAAQVLIRAETVEDATARLQAVGVTAVSVTLADQPELDPPDPPSEPDPPGDTEPDHDLPDPVPDWVDEAIPADAYADASDALEPWVASATPVFARPPPAGMAFRVSGCSVPGWMALGP